MQYFEARAIYWISRLSITTSLNSSLRLISWPLARSLILDEGTSFPSSAMHIHGMKKKYRARVYTLPVQSK